MKDLKEYENLTNLLLEVVRKRPGMFLGQAKISLLNTFLTGYQIALGVNSLENDTYFGENGFNNWFLKLEGKEFSCLQTPFLNKCNNNEQKALELYFEYLEKYRNETQL